jgi:hypothetical protein
MSKGPSTLTFAEGRADLAAAYRDIANILNSCQLCGKGIVRKPDQDGYVAKFILHRCANTRKQQ